jgi:hypothetical protein
MKHLKEICLVLALSVMSATAHAQDKHPTVRSAIENCATGGDYCSGFATGAFMASPMNGEGSICWEGPAVDYSNDTSDRMLANWMEAEVSRHSVQSDDPPYSLMLKGLQALFPCKGGAK